MAKLKGSKTKDNQRKYTRELVKKVRHYKKKGYTLAHLSRMLRVPRGSLHYLFNTPLKNFPAQH